MMSFTRAKTAMVCAVSIIAFSSVALPPCLLAAQRSGDADRPVLQVPAIDSKPVIDGKLDEPCWKDAVRTGPLAITRREPSKSTTEAFILRDADHLYIGVTCGADGQGPNQKEPAEPQGLKESQVFARESTISEREHVALLLDTNRDRNSYYLVVITQKGVKQISYNEQWPPWHDRWRECENAGRRDFGRIGLFGMKVSSMRISCAASSRQPRSRLY